MANDPMFHGGATDVAAGQKVMRLIQLCDTFHLPLVDFADEPGLMVGVESERAGHRAGRGPAACAPRTTAACRGSRSRPPALRRRRTDATTGRSGMFRRYAWPSANWGSMHIAGGASAAYRREIEAAADPDAKRAEIEARLQAVASPFRTAEATGQDIIDPRDTRAAARRVRPRRAADPGSPTRAAGQSLLAVTGLRVVDLSTSLAGAYCTRLFAATGADVVGVEPVGGSPLRRLGPMVGERSALWEYLGAGKRSVGCPTDSDDFDALVRWADLVVSSCDGHPDEALARHERIAALDPSTVHVVVSGYGLTGPYREWRHTDFTDWAAGGHLYITGEPDREPLQGGGPWLSYLAGVVAAIGAMAAVMHAARTGEGQLVDVGAMEAAASLHQWTITMYTHIGCIKRRWGNLLGESSHPVALYRCSDGFISVVAVAPQQWEALCLTMELFDLLADPSLEVIGERFDRAAEIDARINEWLVDPHDVRGRGDPAGAGVPATHLRTMADVLDEPQLDVRRFWCRPPRWGPRRGCRGCPSGSTAALIRRSGPHPPSASTTTSFRRCSPAETPAEAGDRSVGRARARVRGGVGGASRRPLPRARWGLRGDQSGAPGVARPARQRRLCERLAVGRSAPPARSAFPSSPTRNRASAGGTASGMFNKMNRNKRSVAVDAKAPEGPPFSTP